MIFIQKKLRSVSKFNSFELYLKNAGFNYRLHLNLLVKQINQH